MHIFFNYLTKNIKIITYYTENVLVLYRNGFHQQPMPVKEADLLTIQNTHAVQLPLAYTGFDVNNSVHNLEENL